MEESEFKIDPELEEELWNVPVSVNLIKDLNISLGEFRFYLLLMSYARAKTTCFPSRATLAKEMGVGIRAIDKWKASLRDLGLLQWEKYIGKDGREHNIYTLMKYRPLAKTGDQKVSRQKNSRSSDSRTVVLGKNIKSKNTKSKNTNSIPSVEGGEIKVKSTKNIEQVQATKDFQLNKDAKDNRGSVEGVKRGAKLPHGARERAKFLPKPASSSTPQNAKDDIPPPVVENIVQKYRALFPTIDVRPADIRSLRCTLDDEGLGALDICMPELVHWRHRAWDKGSKHLALLASLADHFIIYVQEGDFPSTPLLREHFKKADFERMLDEEERGFDADDWPIEKKCSITV
jgi:hypothetical protein